MTTVLRIIDNYNHERNNDDDDRAGQGFRLRPEAGRFVRSFPIPCPVL